ncbi:hypothetical protein E5288_WYG005733 [Bos mutus]|uniref:Uncharacterized protein n=1 Tax=Bos mutus TaxID=72004 RepID=A0A6B0RR88_9CETA|nr:hypothetical protein [Bos mutus]
MTGQCRRSHCPYCAQIARQKICGGVKLDPQQPNPPDLNLGSILLAMPLKVFLKDIFLTSGKAVQKRKYDWYAVSGQPPEESEAQREQEEAGKCDLGRVEALKELSCANSTDLFSQ